MKARREIVADFIPRDATNQIVSLLVHEKHYARH